MIDNFDEINGGIDPNKLAEEAKEKFEKQKQEETRNSGEDLYSEFRDDEGVSTEDIMSDENLQDLYSTEEPLDEIKDEQADKKYMESQSEHPDIDPYEEPICPGGPLKSEVQIWKKQFNKSMVQLINIGRYVFVFRTLSRPEYKRLISLDNLNGLQREEIICNTTILYPENFDYKMIAGLDAGIPSTLSDIIMEASGFTRNFEIEIL